MDIRQLKYFISVAETSSFSEASRLCFLSQSAISQQIKAMEEELGAVLFVRDTRGVALTDTGRELLPLAREAVKSFSACNERVAELRGLVGGELNLGLTHAMEPYIRRTMVEMMRRHPKVRMNVFYKSTSELRQMLLAHELDLAFTINTAEPGLGIESEPLLSYCIYAVMSATHPLASRTELSLADLRSQGFVLPERSTTALATLESYLNTDLSQFRVRAYINSPNAVLNLLQDTQLVSLLSEGSVDSRSSLVAKPITDLTRPIQCYVHRLQAVCQKRSAQVFMEILHENTF